MIPILYDKTGLNKLGELHDIIIDGDSCVEEERNGLFELSFDYPNGYSLSNQLIEENIIEVKPNDIQGLQKFRIYDTKCLMKDVITVLARHESFDLANDHVENINLENASCEYALNTLFRNSHFSKHYKGYSDIINAQNYSIDNVNILNAIAGKEGSIIDTYGTGAEILRDNTNIHVLNKRGHDNDVTIEFGKNLTDFVLERDLTNLETRVGGFAKYTNADNKEVIVKSNWIDSLYINNFSHPYISIEGRRDYSDKFKDGEIPTVEKLNKLCVDEFLINKRDVPKSNYTIKFIPLSKCVGYEGIQDKISLCDTVRIIDKRFNVDTKAKVIRYKYNFIKERYESMELGEPRTTLGDIITSSDGKDGNDGKNGKDGVNGKDGNDGKNGVDGIPGRPGADGKIYYTWIKYADDSLGNGMSNISTGKEYIGLTYNKETSTESDNPKEYTWSKFRGDQGIPGKPGLDGTPGINGKDGKTYYTWIKYADDNLGSGIADDPEGKAYLGLAFNKPVAQESTNPKEYTWSKIKGEDGKAENMPDTLPNTPILESKVYGMGSVELSWTFENKLYYNYELYANKQKDFKPNAFDLIHAGQSSSFLLNAKPSETWYFKVCAVNSHQRRTPFSNQVEAKLPKVEDMNNYFSEMAIGKAVAQSITADYMKAGIIKGNWIDAKHLSVTDGNGKRTLDIDSFGRITLMPTNFKMIVDDKEEDVITQTSFEATKKDFTFKFQNTGSENLIKNSWFKSSSSHWSFEHWMCGDNSPERSDIGVTTGNMNDGWVPLGQQVGRIINYGGNNQVNKHWHGFGQYVNVEPNTNYTLSFYGAQHRINEVVIEIKKADSKKHIPIGGSMTLDASKIKGSVQQGSSFENDFTLIKHTFQVPADCYQIQILIWSAGRPASNASYLWIGRVQLEKGLEATSRRLNSNEIYNDITTVDGEGIKVTHSNGDYTRMSSQGLKRHRSNGEEKGDYHYLTQYIGFTTTGNTEDLNWIQLKDDFKGKRFTAYSVMSDTWQDSWDWGHPWVIQRFVTFVQEDKIDYANARVPVKGYRVDKNYTTGERRIKPVAGVLLVIA
ncbi:phage tail spike protein [Paraclostridium ghonii]|uniref:phage tail spike protein n=1 Tax=Paraclostridium ghonii TaxID=29358 RepID=UPI00202CE392|nr:phage tail protein [Paeniclostridium ghonii]